MQHVKQRFFARDPQYWPCFNDPSFKGIIDFRKQNIEPAKAVAAYPDGAALHTQIKQENIIPYAYSDPQQGTDKILEFAAALSKSWENPSSVENVITMPSDPAIYGSMIGSLCNANLVHHEYSQMANELEKSVIRQIANLCGYDPQVATGIFTQGGTFCNLYGYLLGIRKSMPDTLRHGMSSSSDYRMINSQGGHYSNVTNLSILGVDIADKTIRIKITENNDIDLVDLEKQLSACLQLNCKVPTIMLTMGTTDTFGVKPVYDLRTRLCEKYDLEIKPHIHVDSAVGWTILFFLDYDFEANPLQINSDTLSGLQKTVTYFHELKYADSFTVDFQKWGYVPYTSSLVMIKNKQDLKALENDPDNFSYFEKETEGYTHLQSTIECSRSATGAFGAYSALKHMGIQGYQVTIANCLQNANYFRHCLRQFPFIKIIAAENQGPSVGYRIYNPELVSNADEEYAYEMAIDNSTEYRERLHRNNLWHRTLFLARGKVGLFTNWVEFIAHSDYDEKERSHRIPGEKAVFMNPATTRKEIDQYISHILDQAANAQLAVT